MDKNSTKRRPLRNTNNNKPEKISVMLYDSRCVFDDSRSALNNGGDSDGDGDYIDTRESKSISSIQQNSGP